MCLVHTSPTIQEVFRMIKPEDKPNKGSKWKKLSGPIKNYLKNLISVRIDFTLTISYINIFTFSF